MTKMMFESCKFCSTSSHSPSFKGDPKLDAATLSSSLCARLISRSAFLSGARKLEPTYKIVIFNPYNPRLNYPFELVFEVTTNLSQTIDDALINLPIPAAIRLQQSLCERVRRVRVQIAQALQHLLIK